MHILDDLTEVLAERKSQRAGESYVASLHQAGLNKILEKIGEVATEVIIAAKDAEIDATQKDELIREVADLWFHSMVLLSELDLSAQDILEELADRFGIGGIKEKTERE
jgi:phosphoribosyl-ATP pyrophosphohydrolase